MSCAIERGDFPPLPKSMVDAKGPSEVERQILKNQLALFGLLIQMAGESCPSQHLIDRMLDAGNCRIETMELLGLAQ